jgi:LacI family transcriptional regulator
VRSVTLHDVAQRCRVSIATVSAVVNRAAWVPDATRERVQRVVDHMGYRPNQLARTLKTRRGYAIGVVVSDLTNPFFTEIVRTLSNQLRADGRAVFLCDSDHDYAHGARNAAMLLDDAQIGGLVIIGDTVPEDVLAQRLRRRTGIPVVAIERDYQLDGVNCLLADSEGGAYEATRHLIALGRRRVALVGGPVQGPGSATFGRAQRHAGYLRALAEAGLPHDARLIAEGNFRSAGGYAAMQRLLHAGPHPDAVFAANDLMAIGALVALREAGLRAPDDVALIGCDDIPIAAQTSPPLSTIAMPMRELGEAAAAALQERLQGRRLPAPRCRRFATRLVARASTGS